MDDNRRLWDARTRVHLSVYKDIDPFMAGKHVLGQLEIDELGDVTGKELLHLQCHFGLDTLSWARLGARVTGVDFSGEAIRAARELAAKVGIQATFIESNVYDLPSVCDQTFDVVFTSAGVLWWLPDLTRWADVVATMLKPGGVFYIFDGHPFATSLRLENGNYTLDRDYFDRGPESFISEGTYADAAAKVEPHEEHGWTHTIGDIVTALAQAGLRLEFLHEHPSAVFRMFPELVADGSGRYFAPESSHVAPLIFSIRANKPATEMA